MRKKANLTYILLWIYIGIDSDGKHGQRGGHYFRPFDFGTLCLAFGLVVRVVRTAHLTGNVLPRILAGWKRLSSPVLTVYVNLVLLYRLTY